jgi:hypothetical protein
LDQKIRSASMNIEQMQVGRQGYVDRLKDELENGQADSTVSAPAN